MKRHVALVGFMASGKSTIGYKLARRLGCGFVDTDSLIAQTHGPVATIFAREGEATFRSYERSAVAKALARDELRVIALGGGAVADEANRALLSERAHCIFIRVSPEQVLARLRASKELRPLLGAAPTLAQIRELYAQRMAHYEAADHIVEAAQLSSREVLEEIALWLRNRGIGVASA